MGRPGGARRKIGVMVPQTRVRTDAADEFRASCEHVGGVNYDHSRTDAERHRALSARRGSRRGACCDLVRPWRGSAQRKVHEERFAARNTFRREFGLLLPFVPAESVLAGNEFFSCKEALPALTLSFRARMQELSAFRSSKTWRTRVGRGRGGPVVATSHPS